VLLWWYTTTEAEQNLTVKHVEQCETGGKIVLERGNFPLHPFDALQAEAESGFCGRMRI